MKRLITISTITALLFGACDRGATSPPPSNNGNGNGEGITYRIVDVYDGDTIELDDGQTIRLVGIDTPEMSPIEPCAEEAKTYTRTASLYKDCYLIYNTSVGDSIDIFGRTLAFVHILPDSSCLNIEIVRDGWSEDWDNYPVRGDYEALFEEAESQAIAADRGIWDPGDNCE